METELPKDNLIVNLSFEFSMAIIEYCELLTEMKRFVISNQLLKAGTSIGANVFEAQSAESRADFIHKIKIASKECFETSYWLLLCQQSKSYPTVDKLLSQLSSIQKVLSKIILTSKSNTIK